MPATPAVHDLTALLRTHMPVWPTSPLPVFEPVGLIARDGYSIERVSCFTHTGTHLDAPFHFIEGGRTVDRIPPEDLVGPMALLDLRGELEGPIIRRRAVESHWPKQGDPRFVLLETGWGAKRAHTREYLYDFPGLEPEAARYLVERQVRGVGIDSLGIDPYANANFEAHKVLLSKDIWLLEALDHLDTLREGVRYTLVVAPLKIEAGSGAMSRVFAWES